MKEHRAPHERSQLIRPFCRTIKPGPGPIQASIAIFFNILFLNPNFPAMLLLIVSVISVLASPSFSAVIAESDFVQDNMADSEGSFFGLKGLSSR